MFRNDRGVRFQDVTTSGGFGHLQKGHAIAFADIENRGQEDIFEEMGGAFVGDAYQSALYRNPGHPGHSITLKLVGYKAIVPRMVRASRLSLTRMESGDACVSHRWRGVEFRGQSDGATYRRGRRNPRGRDTHPLACLYTHEQVLRDLSVDQALLVREGVPAAQVMPRSLHAW